MTGRRRRCRGRQFGAGRDVAVGSGTACVDIRTSCPSVTLNSDSVCPGNYETMPAARSSRRSSAPIPSDASTASVCSPIYGADRGSSRSRHRTEPRDAPKTSGSFVGLRPWLPDGFDEVRDELGVSRRAALASGLLLDEGREHQHPLRVDERMLRPSPRQSALASLTRSCQYRVEAVASVAVTASAPPSIAFPKQPSRRIVDRTRSRAVVSESSTARRWRRGRRDSAGALPDSSSLRSTTRTPSSSRSPRELRSTATVIPPRPSRAFVRSPDRRSRSGGVWPTG